MIVPATITTITGYRRGQILEALAARRFVHGGKEQVLTLYEAVRVAQPSAIAGKLRMQSVGDLLSHIFWHHQVISGFAT